MGQDNEMMKSAASRIGAYMLTPKWMLDLIRRQDKQRAESAAREASGLASPGDSALQALDALLSPGLTAEDYRKRMAEAVRAARLSPYFHRPNTNRNTRRRMILAEKRRAEMKAAKMFDKSQGFASGGVVNAEMMRTLVRQWGSDLFVATKSFPEGLCLTPVDPEREAEIVREIKAIRDEVRASLEGKREESGDA